MADLTSTAKLILTADASGLKREIKSAIGEQKELLKEQLASAEKTNAGLDAQLAKWGKIAAGVGAAVGAYRLLKDSAIEYADHQRAAAAAVGLDIGRVQAAAKGLLTEQQALTLAGKMQASQFRFTQQEIESYAQLVVIGRNRGLELSQSLDLVTKAATEANVEGLRPLGITLKGEAGQWKTHEDQVRAIAAATEAMGGSLSRAGDESVRAGVAWKDAVHKLTLALGELASALVPVVTMAARATSGLVDMIGAASDWVAVGLEGGILGPGTALGGGSREGGLGAYASIFSGRYRRSATREQGLNALAVPAADYLTRLSRDALAPSPRRRGGGGGSSVTGWEAGGGWRVGEMTYPVDVAMGGLGATSTDALAGLASAQRAVGQQSQYLGLRLGEGVADRGGEYRQTFEQVVEGSRVARESMDVFVTAGLAGWQALVTGAESFGAAIKKALAGSLLAKSTELLGEAIRHSVYALGSLAFGDLRGASTHGAAAAKAGAGALALGALAKGLGAGAPGGGGALPAGAAAAAGGAVGGGGERAQSVTVFVGSDFGDNPRASAARLTRALGKARRYQGLEDVVTEG